MNVHLQLSTQFYEWEMRGRGWKVWPEPVEPEPPFRALTYTLPRAVDDGRRPSFFGSLLRKVTENRAPELVPPVIPQADEEEAIPLVRGDLIELKTTLPAKLDLSREAFEPFLSSISLAREPIAFELIGLPGSVGVQFAADPSDAPQVRRQLTAYFPEAVFQTRGPKLEEHWSAGEGNEALIVEFGLAREFVLPLASGKLDPFIGLVGTLSELEPGELGLFQVIFQSVKKPWAESMIEAVSLPDGAPLFVNARELTDVAEKKASRPLFAAVVRVGVKSDRYERIVAIARDLAASLQTFAHPHGNELIPLTNDEYPFEEHVEDLLRRQTRRSGMILSCDELIGFVHLPSSAVRSPALVRQTAKSKAAPKQVTEKHGVRLGENSHLGETSPVYLGAGERVRHVHIIGASGTGKSTLLFNLIRQDIENGEGVGVLDPHGDLIDRILGIIPPERVEDVVLIDPTDLDFPVGFNILSAHSELEKNLLASDLVSVFQRLSISWGEQMGSVLRNAILAFLESSRGGTLGDLRRFLLEPAFRKSFLETVNDPDIVYYWEKGFNQLSGNKSIGPVLTRLDTFLSPKPIRYMVAQPKNRLDFGEIMDRGKIFLAKLSQGQMGRENSFLLGSLFVAKIQQLAMGRQSQNIASRRPFYFYIDEFHNFITASMAEILSGARKYQLGLTLAHQELRQLERDREVASAVLSNPYTRIVFRVGDDDARRLASGFSFFEARDLENLETGEAICRVERADFDFNLSVPLPPQVDEAEATQRRGEVVAASRRKYGTLRSEVEAAMRERIQTPEESSVDNESKRRPSVKGVVEKPQSPPLTSEKDAEAAKRVQSEPKPTALKPSEVPTSSIPTPPVLVPHQPEAPVLVERAVEKEPARIEKADLLPADLGRGGAQHQTIQKRLKATSEGLGFRAEIEKQILDGHGSVDLFLERNQTAIACEISITTTVDHEVGNVVKCLKAEFAHVAVISPVEERLKKIQGAIEGCLGKEERGRVGYYTPERFIDYLQSLVAEEPAPEAEKIVVRRGYRVRRTVATVTAAEAKAREEAALKTMAEVMRRKKRSSSE